eukprot:gene12240-13501_t
MTENHNTTTDYHQLLSGRHVYVCGKTRTSDKSDFHGLNGALKEKLIIDLAGRCFVRSHASPVDDVIDAYYAIVSSNAFVFILDVTSISDIDCLNQLGIAISYNIPVIAVRRSGYNLPKALPMKFYETKIAVKKMSDASSPDNNNNNNATGKAANNKSAAVTLASVLMSCYGNSFEYTAQSYAEFFARILDCLVSLGPDQSDSGSASETSLSEEHEASGSVVGTAVARPSENSQQQPDKNVAIQVIGVDKRKALKPKSQSPQARTTTRKHTDVGAVEQSSALHKQHHSKIYSSSNQAGSVTAVKKLTTTSVLLNRAKSPPVKSHASKSKVTRHGIVNGHVDARSTVKQKVAKGSVAIAKQEIDDDQHSNTNNHLNRSNHTRNPNRQIISVESMLSSPVPRKDMDANVESKQQQEQNNKKLSILGSRPNDKRNNLRRVSSLPVVPTQYLVASENKNSSPKVHTFPPPGNSSLLYPMSADSTANILSGDESDYDAINLSRSCTPVENSSDCSYNGSFSTGESAR